MVAAEPLSGTDTFLDASDVFYVVKCPRCSRFMRKIDMEDGLEGRWCTICNIKMYLQ